MRFCGDVSVPKSYQTRKRKHLYFVYSRVTVLHDWVLHARRSLTFSVPQSSRRLELQVRVLEDLPEPQLTEQSAQEVQEFQLAGIRK